jgi:hypothetical protein
MCSLRLAESMRTRTRQPGRGYHHDRAVAREHLELAALSGACLVDMSGQDELGAGFGQLLEHAATSRERTLTAPPRRVGELVVKADDPQGTRRGRAELLLGPFHRAGTETARLVPPRPYGVDTDDVQAVGRMHRLGRLPLLLELAPRLREAAEWPERDVVVAGHGQYGRRQTPEQRGRSLVLIGPAAVREVARRDHELGLDAGDEGSQGALGEGLLTCPDVDVGDVNQACGHSRGRLYTGRVSDESTESTELFDDLYLGLRAGGAMRKQRRGEQLTTEEEAALGHWQRLSRWRKVIAVGAFALGTFGLGFTIGGIVFGRRRNA